MIVSLTVSDMDKSDIMAVASRIKDDKFFKYITNITIKANKIKVTVTKHVPESKYTDINILAVKVSKHIKGIIHEVRGN